MQGYGLNEVAKKLGLSYAGALLIVHNMGIYAHSKRYTEDEFKAIEVYRNANPKGKHNGNTKRKAIRKTARKPSRKATKATRKERCANAQIAALDSRVLALEQRIAMLEAKMKTENAPEFERYTVTMKADQPKKKFWGIF